MNAIKKALARLADKLGFNQRKLKHRQRKALHFARKAKASHDKALRAEEAADKRRKNGYTGKQKDKEAQRSHRRAHEFQDKAQWWTARVKESQRAIHHLDKLQVVKEAELANWKKKHKVTIRGDTVTGGTKAQRTVAAAIASVNACSSGERRNVYSQAGAWTVEHAISGEPVGYRTDCSQWFTSVYHSCGRPDPNGTDYTWGWTGTLVSHGTQIDKPEPGCAVIYGSGAGHHVEMYLDGDRTAGHGSAPVDYGVVDLFGDHNYRFFKYV